MYVAQLPETQVSKERVQALGWVLLAAGGFLTVVMGTLTVGLAWLLFVPQGPSPDFRFTGTAAQGLGILAFFAFLLSFGIASIVAGIGQIRTGQRNQRFLGFAFLVFAVFVIAGKMAQFYNN
ncbi:MAG TPA: hypothetical protein VFQ91_10785 [Bryobacteraceae bacterium]|nr:hypothetical protein [Bryobacteraceae bacterium]